MQDRLTPPNRVPARPAVIRALVLVAVCLLAVGLAGCSVRVKPRSEPTPARVNVYVPPTPTPQPTATSTPTPLPTTALPPSPTSAPAVLMARPTPTPFTVPVPLGRPDRLVIPDINVDAPVVPVSSSANQVDNRWFRDWTTASRAAGYHEGTALLGQKGNTVISGHNNIDGAVFHDLYRLEPGTTLYLYVGGYRYDYVVRDRFILRENGVPIEQRIQNATWINTTLDERVTLVSCWPPEGNSHRVIVIALPVRSGDESTAGVAANNG